MKILILLGLLEATSSAPLLPRRLLSASNSNELLLNLNNAQLLPLQFQSSLNSLTPPFPGILQQQQQPQVSGVPHFSLATLDRFAGLLPNQNLFPGQVSFVQGSQQGQLDPSQPQTSPQTQKGLNHVMPYIFSFKIPQDQAQINTTEKLMLQYYPVYMYLPWEQLVQTVTSTQLPQQTGQQQYEVQVIPGRQQQIVIDPLIGTAPETVLMPAGGVIAYLQKEMADSRHADTRISMPSSSPKPRTSNIFTSTVNPTIDPELMEEKSKTNSFSEP
ncbi:PREDICTED: odontogenic ameloblast-associated protein [Elephantulus edwardii]|uniref:odontogenic ameloblast-associated protein n=1 Tax=Elephantulus edwardii TaxID=28737 RepID=UPI0003F09992|nr:PREDICTED: odontogenic ameloblast-associated protein [Elephantulus edwardii]